MQLINQARRTPLTGNNFTTSLGSSSNTGNVTSLYRGSSLGGNTTFNNATSGAYVSPDYQPQNSGWYGPSNFNYVNASNTTFGPGVRNPTEYAYASQWGARGDALMSYTNQALAAGVGGGGRINANGPAGGISVGANWSLGEAQNTEGTTSYFRKMYRDAQWNSALRSVKIAKTVSEGRDLPTGMRTSTNVPLELTRANSFLSSVLGASKYSPKTVADLFAPDRPAMRNNEYYVGDGRGTFRSTSISIGSNGSVSRGRMPYKPAGYSMSLFSSAIPRR
jgi:hypothetical protein